MGISLLLRFKRIFPLLSFDFDFFFLKNGALKTPIKRFEKLMDKKTEYKEHHDLNLEYKKICLKFLVILFNEGAIFNGFICNLVYFEIKVFNNYYDREREINKLKELYIAIIFITFIFIFININVLIIFDILIQITWIQYFERNRYKNISNDFNEKQCTQKVIVKPIINSTTKLSQLQKQLNLVTVETAPNMRTKHDKNIKCEEHNNLKIVLVEVNASNNIKIVRVKNFVGIPLKLTELRFISFYSKYLSLRVAPEYNLCESILIKGNCKQYYFKASFILSSNQGI